MTRRIIMPVLAVLLPSGTTNAQFVPPDLRAGDAYHLVFLTDAERDAAAKSIAVYNDFVQSEAEQNPSVTGTDMGVTYHAIASAARTPSSMEIVPARENALISGPVYLLNGERVADGFEDMWDGTIQNPITVNQHLTVSISPSQVWTGSDPDGTPASGAARSNDGILTLGTPHFEGCGLSCALPEDLLGQNIMELQGAVLPLEWLEDHGLEPDAGSDGEWLRSLVTFETRPERFYALSTPITAPISTLRLWAGDADRRA